MKYIAKLISNTAAITGLFCLFCAVGTSDYYTMELCRPEPASVNRLILIGLILLIPSVIHIAHRKEDK